jgi:ABC-type lipoprotein release transport system permease subunit
MGDVEDELVLNYPQKYYQLLQCLRHFELLLQNLQYETNYMFLIMSLIVFMFVFVEIVYIYDTAN